MSITHSKRERDKLAYLFSVYSGVLARVLDEGDLDDESRDTLADMYRALSHTSALFARTPELDGEL